MECNLLNKASLLFMLLFSCCSTETRKLTETQTLSLYSEKLINCPNCYQTSFSTLICLMNNNNIIVIYINNKRNIERRFSLLVEKDFRISLRNTRKLCLLFFLSSTIKVTLNRRDICP